MFRKFREMWRMYRDFGVDEYASIVRQSQQLERTRAAAQFQRESMSTLTQTTKQALIDHSSAIEEKLEQQTLRALKEFEEKEKALGSAQLEHIRTLQRLSDKESLLGRSFRQSLKGDALDRLTTLLKADLKADAMSDDPDNPQHYVPQRKKPTGRTRHKDSNDS